MSPPTLPSAPPATIPGRHGAARGARTLSAVVGLSLAAVGTAIYLSPTGTHTSAAADRLGGRPVPDGRSKIVSLQPAPAATPSTPYPTGPTGTGAVQIKYLPVYNTYRVPGTTIDRRTVVYVPVPRGSSVPVPIGGPSTITVVPQAKRLYCSSFRWQQDAQAAYVTNLSDPWGLDGAPGPHNGDGLACTQLPVDPSRAASRPVDAYSAPGPAEKQLLVQPAARYFGVSQDGLPGDTPLLNRLATQVGKAPSALSWFSTWDTGYDAAKVRAAWSRGALPMITWMTVAQDAAAPTAGSYTLANIVAGKLDSYLLSYAGAVLKTGLPVAIRFDHEMNGNWFPWSGGLKANQGGAGQPNLYVQAWRHIWNVFDSVGANDDVIWVWAPVRVDNIKPHSTVPGFKYETDLADDYPGDQYVDWVGMSAYQYKPSDGWTYEATFRKTLTALRQLCGKPIFISETGATETVGGTQYSKEKAAWTTQTLNGFADEPGVVGFSWFNNTVNDVHTVDGVPIQTDWQFSSSPDALAAFKAGIASPEFSSGVMPDSTGAGS